MKNALLLMWRGIFLFGWVFVFRFPWVETRGYNVGHAYGILVGGGFYFPRVKTHGYHIVHAYGIFDDYVFLFYQFGAVGTNDIKRLIISQ